MSDNRPHIAITEEVLGRYLAGEALPQEALAVDDWIATSDANRNEFERLFRAWQLLSGPGYVAVTPSIAWQELLPRLRSRQPLRLFHWSRAVAAVLLGALLTAAGWWLLQDHPKAVPLKTAMAASGTTPKVSLPDQSVVTLREGSQLRYPQTFTGPERKVLIDGEGYFEVAQVPQQPFVVTNQDLSVKVLGTVFNVARTDSGTRVPVYRGRVQIYNAYGRLTIDSGQTGVYNRFRHSFQLLPVADRNDVGYATLSFYFENLDLKRIAACLSEAYHRKISFADPALGELRMSSSFDRQPLDYILEVIAVTLNLAYSHVGNNEIRFAVR